MKLINARTLEIEEFFSRIPRYAILSHTWEGHEEISYKEMIKGRSKHKKGYSKILKAAGTSLIHGLDYVWVDTCCIDKSSSADLTESINSMFKYYADAVICFAHLSDVHLDKETIDDQLWRSRWFTRGWTLQELLAPQELILYSADWEKLGNREIWKEQIAGISDIHILALSGGAGSLKRFSIAQKMSWAARRMTTRTEDIAYSLLGIFDVNMPLLYGEGEKAFIRLQEEIIKNSDDQTIFAWQSPERPESFHAMSMFADSPSRFLRADFGVLRQWEISKPYSMTNAGLQLTGLMRNSGTSENTRILRLPVYHAKKPDLIFCIIILQLAHGSDQYARSNRRLYLSSSGDFGNIDWTWETIYIRKEIVMPTSHEMDKTGKEISFEMSIRALPDVFMSVKYMYPTDGQNTDNFPPNWHIKPPKGNNDNSIPQYGHNWSWKVIVFLDVRVSWREKVSADGSSMTPFQESYTCLLYLGYNGKLDCCWSSIEKYDQSALDLSNVEKIAKERWGSFIGDMGFPKSSVRLETAGDLDAWPLKLPYSSAEGLMLDVEMELFDGTTLPKGGISSVWSKDKKPVSVLVTPRFMRSGAAAPKVR
jgi:hypothetical protein